jgi:hypothetical protein
MKSGIGINTEHPKAMTMHLGCFVGEPDMMKNNTF